MRPWRYEAGPFISGKTKGTDSLMNIVLRPLALVYTSTAGFFRFIGDLAYLIGDTLAGVRRSLFDKQGRRLGWQNLWAQMNRVGVRSIPIVCLVLFCIG